MALRARERIGGYLSRQARQSGPAVDGWTPGPVSVGRDDHRPFTGVDDLDPLYRLARYRPLAEQRPDPPVPAAGGAGPAPDEGRPEPVAGPNAGEPGAQTAAPGRSETARGEALRRWIDPVRQFRGQRGPSPAGPFHEVAPGSLADVPRINVFVHGWLPGGQAHAEEVYAAQGQVVRAWDEGVTNVYGNSPVRSYAPLLESLAVRDPAAAVLWFSWVDQSGTDTSLFAARRSLRHTAINGRRLAAALAAATRPDGDEPGAAAPLIHLIGHSHGCVVATTAALALSEAPVQLTLLDCPEDWFSRTGGAAGLLTGVLPRLHPGRGPRATFVDAYASMFGRSYHDDAGCSEVVDVRLAPTVDKMLPESSASQAHQFAVQWYRRTVADPQAAGGYQWSPLTGFDTAALGSGYLATTGGRMVELVRRKVQETEDPYLVAPLAVQSQRLTVRSPDVSYILDVPPDAVFVEFDLAFERPGRAARVDGAVDGNLVFTSYAAHPVPRAGRYLRVEPGRNVIAFRLVDAGLFGAATVQNLRVVRAADAPQNLDDRAAMVRVAAIGAAAGSASTLTVLAGGYLVGRVVRSWTRWRSAR